MQQTLKSQDAGDPPTSHQLPTPSGTNDESPGRFGGLSNQNNQSGAQNSNVNNQNYDATSNDDSITQPHITNDAVPSSSPGHSPGTPLSTGAGGGESVLSTSSGQWQQPPPSLALKEAPPPFTGYYPSETEYESDDDEPFHGFPTQTRPPPGFNYSQGRPKRNTRKPDRLEYNTFAVRNV